MQKIIPFKKETNFKDNVSEITSISLEHTLHKEEDNLITGEFLVSGDYKVVETSSVIDNFSFRFPFDIHLDEKYDLEKVIIDIDDFYYEIKNNNTLVVNIDVLLDKLEEKKEELKEVILERSKLEEDINDVIEEKITNKNIIEENNNFNISDRNIYEDVINPVKIIDNKQELEISEKKQSQNDITNIFDDIDNKSNSAIYKVYIVREEDTLFSITEKYGVNKEILEKYNNLKEIKKGDKLIIPCE